MGERGQLASLWGTVGVLGLLVCLTVNCEPSREEILKAASDYHTKGAYKEAAEAYRIAGDQLGDPVGKYHYARHLEQGLGVPRDLAEAQRYYDAAAGTSSKDWPQWTEQ